ncbi:MAG TPA: hypothetical protein ENJ82_04980 [Bacteroidetes bacterium]|nr:hypothetical protein [Bacteroidota bacterium]
MQVGVDLGLFGLEEYLRIDSKFFLISDYPDCADSMAEIFTCEEDLHCRIGGMAGFSCPGFEEFGALWHVGGQ